MTTPCIVMTGTRPIFNLVQVTQELSEAVAAAQYPRSPTVVKKCVVAFIGGHPSGGTDSSLLSGTLPVLDVYVIRGHTMLPDNAN